MVTEYTCSKCSKVFGEGIALRAIELYDNIICIDCGVSEGERLQAIKDAELSTEFWEGE